MEAQTRTKNSVFRLYYNYKIPCPCMFILPKWYRPPPRRWTQYRHWLAPPPPPFQFASDVDISKIIMYKIIWKTYKHTCNAHTMTMIPSEIPVEFCYSLDFRTWIWYPWKHVKYTLLKNSWRKIITIRLSIRAFIVILGNCALIKSSRVYGSCVKHTSSDHSPIQKPSRLINHELLMKEGK